MTDWATYAQIAASLYGAYSSSDAAKKASKGIPQGGFYDPVNISEIDELVRETSRRNIEEGLATEQEFRPEFAQMRGEVDSAALQRLRRSLGLQDDTDAVRGRFLEDLLGPDEILEMPEMERSPLMDAAFERAMADLEMGGALPREIQNMVSRAAMSRAPQGMGRDVAARDLGLTGLQLQQQRLGTASNLGQFQTGVNQQQQGLRHAVNLANQNLLGQRRAERSQGLGFLDQLGFRDFSSAAGMTMGTQLPQTGLDPASIADITIADRQAQAAALQQEAAMRAEIAGQKASGMGDGIGGAMEGMGKLFAGGGFSDRRLKTDIEKVGERADGLGVYEFNYTWGGERQRGYMADEVEKVYPDAVSQVDGYAYVDYSQIPEEEGALLCH